MLNISFVLLLDDPINAKVYLANFFDTLVSYQNLNYDIVILNNSEDVNNSIGKHYRGYKYNVINVKDHLDRISVLNVVKNNVCRFKTICVANLNFKHKPYFVNIDENDKKQVKKAVKLIAKTTKIRNDVDKQTYKKIAIGSKSALFVRLIKFVFRHPLTAFRAIFARKVSTFLRLSKDNPQLASEKLDIFLSHTNNNADGNNKIIAQFNDKYVTIINDNFNIGIPANALTTRIDITANGRLYRQIFGSLFIDITDDEDE